MPQPHEICIPGLLSWVDGWSAILFGPMLRSAFISLGHNIKLVYNYLKLQPINMKEPQQQLTGDMIIEPHSPTLHSTHNGYMTEAWGGGHSTRPPSSVVVYHHEIIRKCSFEQEAFQMLLLRQPVDLIPSISSFSTGRPSSTQQTHTSAQRSMSAGQIPWRLLLFTFICAFGLALDLRQVGNIHCKQHRPPTNQHPVNCNGRHCDEERRTTAGMENLLKIYGRDAFSRLAGN